MSGKVRAGAKAYPCPSCGFYTMDEELYGSYHICEICGWEDDGMQLANPACSGGANELSLIESQKIILERVPIGVDEYKGFKRDRNWRPVRSDEIEKYEKERDAKYWTNMGVVTIEEVYWSKNK